jgi:hypothetical protein
VEDLLLEVCLPVLLHQRLRLELHLPLSLPPQAAPSVALLLEVESISQGHRHSGGGICMRMK